MPMKVPVFCAGALQVRWSYFLSVVLSARVIRYFALAYLGKHYGHQTFRFLISHLPVVIAVGVGLALLIVLILQFIDRRQTPETPSTVDSASADR